MELVEYLPTAVNRVKMVKTDKERTLYSVLLYKLYILRKITQQIFYKIFIKGTYPFKYIYFNIIIKENRFNKDAYIVYF